MQKKKLYTEAVRDLFRNHCESHRYSGDQITNRIVEYYYTTGSPEAEALYLEIRDDIQKLRYKPRSESVRDLSFENKQDLLDWVIPYLVYHEEFDMEMISLSEHIHDLAKSFNLGSSSEEQDFFLKERLGSYKDYQSSKGILSYSGYEAFIGKSYARNFPKSQLCKVMPGSAIAGGGGVVCSLFSFRANLLDPTNEQDIYWLRFFETKSNQIDRELIFGAEAESAFIELIGLLMSSSDSLFVFKDRMSANSYIAKCSEANEGEIGWEFLSTVPDFSKYFMFKKSNSNVFPKMLHIVHERRPALVMVPCLPDGTEVFKLVPKTPGWLVNTQEVLGINRAKKAFNAWVWSVFYVRNDLNKAIVFNSERDVRRILAKNPEAINKTDADGNKPWVVALLNKRWGIFDVLLRECDVSSISQTEKEKIMDLLRQSKFGRHDLLRKFVKNVNSK